MVVEGLARLDVFVEDVDAAIGVSGEPEADEGGLEAEVDGQGESWQWAVGSGQCIEDRSLTVAARRGLEVGSDVYRGVEGGEHGTGGAGAEAEHLAVPGFFGDPFLEGDGVVDRDEAVTVGLGAALAFGEERTGIAVSGCGALFKDVEETP